MIHCLACGPAFGPEIFVILGALALLPNAALALLLTVTVKIVKYCKRSRQETIMNRRRNSICVQCGYDLRATPCRCPECGLVAARWPGLAMN